MLCPDSDDKNRLLDLVTVLHSNASEAFTEIDRALKKNLTHTQSLDMMQLIKDSIRPLQFKLENVHLVWPDTSSSVSIEGNEAQLKHLFFNIFYNAYLSIQKALATRAITQGRISICLECDSVGKIIIQISDNGIGLSEETRNQAMNGNFTGWPELGGTGNGIAICREFAALHGGSFDIHGTADGACATVILKRPKP